MIISLLLYIGLEPLLGKMLAHDTKFSHEVVRVTSCCRLCDFACRLVKHATADYFKYRSISLVGFQDVSTEVDRRGNLDPTSHH
ncbi:hypothetical protein MTO96_013306 [Rhipicephalus appendiculatus]